MKRLNPNPKIGHRGNNQMKQLWIVNWHGLPGDSQLKIERVPSPWHKGAVNGIKSGSDNGFIPYSAPKKNTGLSMILENNDYWASCKATLVPCFVVLELWPTNMSHLPVDTVLGGTGGALQVERGLHLLVPELFPRAPTEPLSACACLAGNVKASGAHSPAVQAPEAAFPRALAPSQWLPTVSLTPCLPPHGGTSARCIQWATHPLQWDPNLSLVGRERARPSLSLPWVLSLSLQVTAAPCSC